LHFQRDATAFFALFGREEVQAFEADHAATAILDENYVVVRFFTDVLLLRVIEPDGQRVPLAIEVDPHFFQSSTPALTRFEYPFVPRQKKTSSFCGTVKEIGRLGIDETVRAGPELWRRPRGDA